MDTEQLKDLRNALGIVAQALVDVLDAIDGEPDLETADQPDDECNGDLESSVGNDEREFCQSDYGDITWNETHGFGHIMDWSYEYEKWNQCSPLSVAAG